LSPFLLCLFLLGAFAFAWQVNLNEQYILDYDEGVFLISARMATLGYPLFTSVFSSQPPVFLEILALAFRLFGDTVTVGREVMIFFSLTSLGAAAWISWRLVRPIAAPLAIISLGLPIVFFRQARIVQAEMPALAFALLAVGATLSFKQTGHRKWLAVGGLFFALGGLCKLLIVPMIVPILFLFVPEPPSNKTERWRFPPIRPSLFPYIISNILIFGCAGLAAILLATLLYNFPSAYDQVISFHIEMRNHFQLNRLQNLFLFGQLFQMEFGIILLAIAGIAVLFRKNPVVAVWLCVWTAATGLFLTNHSPLYLHHVILIFPPLAIAASASVILISDFWQKPWSKLLLLITLFPLVSYGPDSRIRLTIRRDLMALTETVPNKEQEYEVITLIRQHSKDTDLVISDQQMQVFHAGRQTPPQLCDTSYARVMSGYLKDEQAIRASEQARMIIFWTNRLANLPQYRQWVRSHYHLLRKFDGTRGVLKEVYVRD